MFGSPWRGLSTSLVPRIEVVNGREEASGLLATTMTIVLKRRYDSYSDRNSGRHPFRCCRRPKT